MHENNFEKQVREKMDHLGFTPSDAVWAAVDTEINKERKRRPIFWIFFFSGLVLAGAGFYFAVIKGPTHIIPNAKLQSETGNKQAAQSPDRNEISAGEKNPENNTVVKSSIGNDKTRMKVADVKTGKGSVYSQGTRAVNPPIQNTKSGLNENGSKDPLILDPVKDESSAAATVKNEKIKDTAAMNNTAAAGLVKSSLSDSTTTGKATSKKNQQVKSSSWKIGFTANAGISSINQSLFKPAYTSNPVTYAANPPGNTAGAPGGVYGSANLNPGFAAGIGVVVSRNLTKRFSFSAGLSYRYYSTKLNTGKRVDSSVYVNTGAPQYTAVSSFYRNVGGYSYTNQYHFVELPITVGFQLTKSNKRPVIWEAGVALAYLLNSNALHFDPYANVYFKNNDLLNRTQVNTSTAILVGFKLHNGQLQLGPQVQYGLTGLLKGNTSGSEHLFYYGLKFFFVPSKK